MSHSGAADGEEPKQQRVERWIAESHDKPIVIFDGLCGMCSWTVDFILKHESAPRLRFAAMQSEAGRALCERVGLEAERLGSVVLISGGAVYQRSEAVLLLAKELRAPWRWLAFFRALPGGAREAAYRCVARNRYRVAGRREQCRIPLSCERERFLEHFN